MSLVTAVSNRKFGLESGVALLALGLIGEFLGWTPVLTILLVGLAFAQLVLAWVFPPALTVANRTWFAVADVIGRIVAPVVLGLFFVVFFVPTGQLMRLIGRDELKLRDSSGETFWVSRPSPVVAPESFARQY